MTRRRERAFAGFFAVLFLITSSAVAISVIITLIQQHDQKASTTATTTPTTSSTSSKETKPVTPTTPAKQLANFTPTASVTALQSTDPVPGTGAVVKPGDTITVNYTGAVAATGTIFQSSSSPVTFSLSQVIAGWTQGIPGMKVGGTRRLLIPANLAYGASPPSGSGIPANAALVFDVTVTKID